MRALRVLLPAPSLAGPAPLGWTTLRQSDDEWAANPMAPAVRIGW